MTQATKVAEIFSVAGEAFTKLSKLAMSLQSNTSQDGGKWEDEEIDMLRKAISQFGNDIERISEKIKTKSTMQIKNTLKGKVAQNLTNYPNNRNVNAQKTVSTTPIQNTNMDAHPVSTSEHITKTPEQHVMKPPEQHITKAPEQHMKPPDQFITKLPDQYVMKPPEQQVTKPPEHHATKPPGLQHIAVRAPVIPTEQNNMISMKPRLITIQGQNISERTPVMAIDSQSPTIGAKNLAMKPTGVTTPASIITSQLNKSPSKMQSMPVRTISQKTKMDALSVTGMMSLADAQSPTKKVKVDSPNLNILTSALLNQKPMNGTMNAMNRSQASSVPGVVPNQGFQVLMPSSAKTLYPISVRPTGIVQRVSDANSTTGNIDVES